MTFNRIEALNYSPEIMADTNREGWIPVAMVREGATWRVEELEEVRVTSRIFSAAARFHIFWGSCFGGNG